MTPAIRGWFRDAGFAEAAFHLVPDSEGSVGVQRLTGRVAPFVPGVRLFTFLPGRRA